MSAPNIEVDEMLWELYLNWCRAHGVPQTIKGYSQWKQEQDYDEDTPDWNEIFGE